MAAAIPAHLARALSVCALLVFGTAGPAHGQVPASPAQADPVLEALVEEALARNPDLQSAQAGIDASRTAVERARARPDPMVSMAFTNDGWAPSLGRMPMTTLGIMVSQELPWPGKRRLRADVAASRARESEPALSRARLTLEASVRRAYYALVLARELQALTADQRTLLQQIESVARARYAVGQGTQTDVLRAQTEVTRLEQRAVEQEAEADVRLAEINRLLARPHDTPVATIPRLAFVPMFGTAQDAVAEARAVSPELQAARLAVETNLAAAALARRELKPDLTVQGGFMNRGGLDPMWVAGVGVSWPFDKKARESAIAEAEILAKGGAHGVESLGLQLDFRTRERFTRARAAERLVALYDGGVLPQDQMTVESALANYQAGKVPFTSVLESMAAFYADRWTRASLIAEHARLAASLREASLDADASMGQAAPPAAAAASMGRTGAVAGGMGGK